MPRLFTGLKLPPVLAQRLSFLKGGLRGARWIDEENYHITLRFIGDVDGHVADDIAEGLAHIDRPRFDLRLDGLGSFGTRKPHSVWARVEPEPRLLELQGEHERVIQRAGLPPEGRKFTPHVTLARVRDASPGAIANWLAMRGEFSSAPFPVSDFVLYSARASRGGGPYVVEETYSLAESPEAKATGAASSFG